MNLCRSLDKQELEDHMGIKKENNGEKMERSSVPSIQQLRIDAEKQALKVSRVFLPTASYTKSGYIINIMN